MMSQKIFTFGKVRGVIYDFEEVNDILPLHQHNNEDNHMTIIARGRFLVKCSAWEKELRAGDVIDWPPNDPHEFIAKRKNSRIVNILKG